LQVLELLILMHKHPMHLLLQPPLVHSLTPQAQQVHQAQEVVSSRVHGTAAEIKTLLLLFLHQQAERVVVIYLIHRLDLD
jgi:hypothetical protein